MATGRLCGAFLVQTGTRSKGWAQSRMRFQDTGDAANGSAPRRPARSGSRLRNGWRCCDPRTPRPHVSKSPPPSPCCLQHGPAAIVNSAFCCTASGTQMRRCDLSASAHCWFVRDIVYAAHAQSSLPTASLPQPGVTDHCCCCHARRRLLQTSWSRCRERRCVQKNVARKARKERRTGDDGLGVCRAKLVDVLDGLVHGVHQLQRQRQRPVLVLGAGRRRQPQRARALLAAIHGDVCGGAGTAGVSCRELLCLSGRKPGLGCMWLGS